MTYWNLSFDAIAIFFLLLIFVWYFSEKKIPLRSHRVFLYLIFLVLAATGLEIASTLMARNMNAAGYDVFYLTLTLQTLAINLVPVTFSYYLLLLAHINLNRHKALRALYIICMGTDAAVILLNPFLHWAFTFENDMYKTAPAGYALYIIDFITICICIATIARYKEKFMFLRIIPLAFNRVCGLLACMAQIVFYYPFLNCALAAMCLTLFHYQQNSGTVTDTTTDLFNRKFLGEYIENKYSYGSKSFGVIIVALDDFKFVNKTYGVETGDHMLYQVGQFLECCEQNAPVFRFGSDQFCILFDNKEDELNTLSEKIHDRFKHPWYDENHVPIMMSASISCINCPEDAGSYRELIEVIDYSMSISKKTRKGLITFARTVNLDNIKRDKAIERAVKMAMAKNELMVYYQPIFSVSKGVYNSAEALVRLKDEELGWISPEEFIPISEKNGLIVEMGEIILDKVCRFIRDFKLSETSVEYVEVNISPVQLTHPDFADRVKTIIEKYGVSPEQINMEITETATLSSASMVLQNINKLIEYGIAFSLDDFGSGNANISYINTMPFKIIKIDKNLIWDAFTNDTAGITLEYTINMLNALKLNIVAEGVETEEMTNQLADFGCHYMQGWFYSKAIPAEDFMNVISR